jgi:hypothetical protein
MSLIPYKYDVSYNSSILIIPAFPGAYIYNRGIDSSPTALPVPIYMSNPVAGNDFSFMNDADYMLLVLPGFKIVIYDTVNFGFTSTNAYTVDNTTGTDLMFYANRNGYTGSSYKLYYGIQEIAQNTKTGIPSISYGNANVTTNVVYDGTSYTLYSYKTTGSSSFQYNDTGTTTGISAQILLVAGGGAGGQNGSTTVAGGGGGGGVAYGSMTFAKGVSYSCTVGNGGQIAGAPGENSLITNPSSQSITVIGGGGGKPSNTANGGSGGGAYRDGNTSGIAQTGSNSIGASVTFSGNNGGASAGNLNVAGGGGGAGGAGGDSNSNNVNSGNGGAGFTWSVNGATYAGGGGGGQQSNGADPTSGGSGGGGGGGRANGDAGALNSKNLTQPGDGGTNTGGGGGGAFYNYTYTIFLSQVYSATSSFGKGGSGIIIIAVKTSDLNAYSYV